MYSTLVTRSQVDAVSLAEAKAQARVLHDAEDALLGAYIKAATQHVEDYTRRALIEQTWEVTLDGFPAGGGPIRLPRTPLIAVESITYTKPDGDASPVAGYQTETRSTGTYIYPAFEAAWPATRAIRGSVKARYTAGYGATPQSIPEPVRLAILVIVATYYANRESQVVGNIVEELPTVKSLLGPYRILSVP